MKNGAPTQKYKTLPFTNLDNRKIYQSLAPGVLTRRADEIGLSLFPDLEILKRKLADIVPSDESTGLRILEIGFGEGRVLRWLLKHFETASVTGLEVSEKLVERLPPDLIQKKGLQIIHSSVLEYEPESAFNVALLLWSAFMEFNPAEKAALLSRLHQILLPGGLVAIDLPYTFFADAISGDETFQVHVYEGERICFHLIPDQELVDLAKRSGFAEVEKTVYQTRGVVKQDRVLFLLRKA